MRARLTMTSGATLTGTLRRRGTYLVLVHPQLHEPGRPPRPLAGAVHVAERSALEVLPARSPRRRDDSSLELEATERNPRREGREDRGRFAPRDRRGAERVVPQVGPLL